MTTLRKFVIFQAHNFRASFEYTVCGV
jgi:hypothetical protein